MTNDNTAAAVPQSFYWYDLETSGTDPASDRIMQFAGWRTDAALEPVGDPFVTYIRLTPDVLPSPEACLVTGISPQRVNADGIDEWQALTAIDEQLSTPNTCVLGYNNLRFDDHFLRFALYRNLLDPYAREWQGGNSRWDLIDLARAACALRPAGLRWPSDGGVVSFRLERLAAENGIAHDDPHDALADVKATIGLARLLKTAQPRLWDFALGNRGRESLQRLLFPLGKLCLHVSQQFSNERRCAAPVVALAAHPQIANRVIVADLGRDIAPLVECDASELRQRLFAPRDEGANVNAMAESRPPLKVVVMNRCPFVAPIEVVRTADAKRLGIDMELAKKRRRQLMDVPELAEKIADVYRREALAEAPEDAEFALYDGFVEDADKGVLERLQAALVADPAAPWPRFKPADKRLRVLGERLKAHLRPLELDAAERQRWRDHIRRCLRDGFGERPSLAAFRTQIEELLAAEPGGAERRLLHELKTYADGLEQAPVLESMADQPQRSSA